MIRLAAVIEAFEADFLAQYGGRLTPAHGQALAAMKCCRTQASLKMQVQCTACEHQKLVPHSCGHRHCPHCQHHESQQWLERQLKKQLPAEYFLLTFTLPAEFRALTWANQGVVYELLLQSCWQTVHTFAQNDRQLQGTPGAIAVLHTNTRRLDYHPQSYLRQHALSAMCRRKHRHSPHRWQAPCRLLSRRSRFPARRLATPCSRICCSMSGEPKVCRRSSPRKVFRQRSKRVCASVHSGRVPKSR